MQRMVHHLQQSNDYQTPSLNATKYQRKFEYRSKSFKKSSNSLNKSLNKPRIFSSMNKSSIKQDLIPKQGLKKFHESSKTNNNNNKNCQIYFNELSKQHYIKKVIDKYFNEQNESNISLNNYNIITMNQNKKKINPKSKQIKQKKNYCINLLQFSKKQHAKDRQFQTTSKNRYNISPIISSSLPPINQQETSTSLKLQTSTKILNNSSSTWNKFLKHKQKQSQSIYEIKLITPEGYAPYYEKSYFLNGQQILAREKKMLKYSIPKVWKENNHQSSIYQCAFQYSFRNKLMHTHQNETFRSIEPTKLHKALLANHCQELIILLRNLCSDLMEIQGKVINHSINLSNIFFENDERLVISEWGFSSFKETIIAQKMQLTEQLDPILKNNQHWLVQPEYLAPEVLQNMLGNQNIIDLWTNPSASHIWAIGLMFFQILTLIPLNCDKKCIIRPKNISNRCGLFHNFNGNLKIQLFNLKKIQKTIRKCIQAQLTQDQYNQNLINLILQMLQYDHQKRIQLSEILLQL